MGINGKAFASLHISIFCIKNHKITMKKREKIKNKIEMPTSSFVSLHAPYTGRICRYTAAYSNLDFYSNLHLL